MEDFKSPDEGGPDEIMPTPGDPAGKQNLEAQAMALLAEEKKQKKKRNTSRLGQSRSCTRHFVVALLCGPQSRKPVLGISGQSTFKTNLLRHRD